MCKDCFEHEHYRFDSSNDFDKFIVKFDSKIAKTIHFINNEEYRTTVYKCSSCNEIWYLSEPDNHWRGYFLKEKKAICQDEMKENLSKYGCLVIIVIFLFILIKAIVF